MTGRQRAIIAILGLSAACVCGVLAALVGQEMIVALASTPTPMPTHTPTPGPPTTTPTPAAETAQVVNIVDGDTIDVQIGGQTFRVRYIGMNTPEVG